MPSREALEREIARLESRLLQEVTSEFPAVPTLEEAILINAYVVLAHGCIEEYVEALFQEHADDLSAHPCGSMVSRAIAMAAFAWQEGAKSKAFRDRTLDDILKVGSSRVEKAISGNHGIKEANVENLAKAAGVEWPPFEAVCNLALTQLETLGGKRGSVAHVSASKTQITNSPIYPFDARNWVTEALAAIQVIEAYLADCR